MDLVCASISLSMLIRESFRAITRSPYGPEKTLVMIIKHGFYWRYGPMGERERVQRHKDKRTGRTFSLLPDALLPYHQPSTATILGWLMEIFLKGSGAATVARTTGAARSTVRRIRKKFEEAVKILRLPGHEGALAPAAFLEELGALGPDGVAALFATWKELEPKHSVVGVYPR
jgi:hypothetical protein